jgi:uncharacterized membrane protein
LNDVDLRRWLQLYAVAAVLFLVIDLVWLSVIATPLYDALLGDLLAEQPNALAAALFYLLFLAGLVHFVIGRAVAEGSLRRAVLDGGFFGLVTYATWDLTSLAVLADFPAALVPIDLAWGAVLAAAVSAGTFLVHRRFLAGTRGVGGSAQEASPGTTSAPGSSASS